MRISRMAAAATAVATAGVANAYAPAAVSIPYGDWYVNRPRRFENGPGRWER